MKYLDWGPNISKYLDRGSHFRGVQIYHARPAVLSPSTTARCSLALVWRNLAFAISYVFCFNVCANTSWQ